MTAPGPFHGFLLSKGMFSTIEPPGRLYRRARLRGINSRGDIVGQFLQADVHGFLFSGGTFTVVDVPGAVVGGTRVRGINARGDITGLYDDSSGNEHGFVATK